MIHLTVKSALFLILFYISGVSATAKQTPHTTNPPAVTGQDIVESAMKYLGIPYQSGKMNPKIGFDCSGFTTYVFKQANITLTRSSRSQFREGTGINCRKQLKLGDLVFFRGSHSRKVIGHVGIVTKVNEETGTFSFIHASKKGICISLSTEPYYNKRYVGARRILSL